MSLQDKLALPIDYQNALEMFGDTYNGSMPVGNMAITLYTMNDVYRPISQKCVAHIMK